MFSIVVPDGEKTEDRGQKTVSADESLAAIRGKESPS
jgi:hypothetical protein